MRVVILYPKGLVSPRQEQQLTCWGDNIVSLRVDGTFDDCQRLVKEAFLDGALCDRHRLSSANSINVGRLLPQAVPGLRWWEPGLTGRRKSHVQIGSRIYQLTASAIRARAPDRS